LNGKPGAFWGEDLQGKRGCRPNNHLQDNFRKFIQLYATRNLCTY
jgi:hypothetical protein